MFKKAERKQVKFKMALLGPSGSGKTYSALLIAKGMGKKIALIDTENGSASLYAGVTDFDTLEVSPPYTIKKYVEALNAAVKAGYDVLVIDSLSHAWAGEGGLIEQKESLDKSGRGNSYTNWATITKQHEQLKSVLINADIHLIATMRSKQDYILVENDKGKQAPKKVGMAPIQREGMEYEFSTVLDIDMSHKALASKDRTGLFSTEDLFQPSEETGKKILEWLGTGKAVEKVQQDKPDDPARQATADEVRQVMTEVKAKLFMDTPRAIKWLEETTGIKSSAKWTLRTVNMVKAELSKPTPQEESDVPLWDSKSSSLPLQQ